MKSKAPLTLILSSLRAGRGESERTCLGSLFVDPDTVPPKISLSLRKRGRVRARVHLDSMDTAKSWRSRFRAALELAASIPTKVFCVEWYCRRDTGKWF